MTSVNELFEFMRGHRVPPPGCSHCGQPSTLIDEETGKPRYFRDALERPYCIGCICVAWADAEVAHTAARKRLRTLGHDCPAEGCLTCSETGA